MSGNALIVRLASVIAFLANYPQGFSMMRGTVSPPALDDIREMFESSLPGGGDLGTRIDRSPSYSSEADRWLLAESDFNGVVTRAGGWAHINTVTNEWASRYPGKWNVVTKYYCWVKPNKSRADGGQLEKLANEIGVSVNTVYRYVDTFAQDLAGAILRTPVEVIASL